MAETGRQQPAGDPVRPGRARRVGLGLLAGLACAGLGAGAAVVVAGRGSGARTPPAPVERREGTSLRLRPVERGRRLTGSTPCPNADGTSPRTTTFSGPPPTCIDPSMRYTAVLQTTKGRITVALDTGRAPTTVNSFVVLARYHYFDGIPFHRVIPGYLVQGGDPDANGRGGPGYTIPDELPPAGDYEVGSVAMANAGPNTNGSQFFIVTGPAGVRLPPTYSLFGKVTGGMEVVKSIESLGSPAGAPGDVVAVTSVQIRTA